MSEFPVERAEEFQELLRSRVSKKTYAHCVSVAKMMLSIAEEGGITAEQAVTAGLLHDLCKAMKPAELIEAATLYGMPADLGRPNLLHGPVAAEECRRWLGIEDEDVIDAIRCHTTGRADWSRVGQALYIADFSEPLRTHAGVGEAREILHRDGFEAALLFVIDQKLNQVKKRHSLHPNSKDFAKWAGREFVS